MVLELPGRLKSRKVYTSKHRTPWRVRRQKSSRTALTSAEKAALRAKRKAAREDLNQALQSADNKIWEIAHSLADQFPGHNATYFYQQIMQRSRKQDQSRKVSLWNAFLRIKKDTNGHRLKASKLSQEYSKEWKEMSHEDQLALTKDTVAEMEAERAERSTAVHNLPISAFHDARATLNSIGQQIQALNARTGTEIVMIAVRAHDDQYLPPFLFTTSSRVEDYFTTVINHTLLDITSKFEAYCLSGVQGVVQSHATLLRNLKKLTKDVINLKLKETAHPVVVSHMVYTTFDYHITYRYGIVIENWPVEIPFTAPSTIGSKKALEVLKCAFMSGATKFRRMSPTEHEAWKATYDKQATALPSVVPPSSAPSPMDAAITSLPTPPSTQQPASVAGPSNAVAVLPPPQTPVVAGMGVTFATGNIQVPKKRKERSDKGVKRGPRAKPGNTRTQ